MSSDVVSEIVTGGGESRWLLKIITDPANDDADHARFHGGGRDGQIWYLSEVEAAPAATPTLGPGRW